MSTTDVLRSRGPGLRGLLVELGLVAAALALNLLVRWYTLDELGTALTHAHDVLALERRLGLDWEHGIQDATLAVSGLSALADWFYVWGYFPVVVAGLVWLYATRPTTYAVLRNGLLSSGAIGLFFYAFYPCAPPRLTDLGYTDTVASGALDAAARPLGVANELAAIPSFHIAWLVVLAVVVYRATDSSLLRVLCVVHPVVMSYVIVATANHWVLDIPAGVALGLVGLFAADRISQRTRQPALQHAR
jgi:hypothetical protein